jgi:hypothetical protein
MNLQREKEERTRKIKRLLQLATYLERSLDTEDQTPEQKGFFLVLHQIQNEYEPLLGAEARRSS